MPTMRTLPLLLLAASLGAQAPKAEAPKPAKAAAPKPAPVAVEAKAPKAAKKSHKAHGAQGTPESIVNDMNARFAKAMEAGDAAAVAAIYTDDAELHMGKDVFKGRDGIKGFAEGFIKATPVRTASVTSTAAHRKGNTITDTGTFNFQVDDHGKTATMSGTYVQMLWRGKDGQWHLHRDWPFPAAPAK
jgi:uncharacterized protein (TIGR02246 family)